MPTSTAVIQGESTRRYNPDIFESRSSTGHYWDIGAQVAIYRLALCHYHQKILLICLMMYMEYFTYDACTQQPPFYLPPRLFERRSSPYQLVYVCIVGTCCDSFMPGYHAPRYIGKVFRRLVVSFLYPKDTATFLNRQTLPSQPSAGRPVNY